MTKLFIAMVMSQVEIFGPGADKVEMEIIIF